MLILFQTFINFNYQKFPAMRLVTIFCDTIACFLGLGNATPLSQCTVLKGNNMYSAARKIDTKVANL